MEGEERARNSGTLILQNPKERECNDRTIPMKDSGCCPVSRDSFEQRLQNDRAEIADSPAAYPDCRKGEVSQGRHRSMAGSVFGIDKRSINQAQFKNCPGGKP